MKKIILLLFITVNLFGQNTVAKKLILNGNTLTDATTGDTLATLEWVNDTIAYYMKHGGDTLSIGDSLQIGTTWFTSDDFTGNVTSGQAQNVANFTDNAFLYERGDSIMTDDSLIRLDIYHDKSYDNLQIIDNSFSMRNTITPGLYGQQNVSFASRDNMSSITTGTKNNAFGNGALNDVTSGESNSAFGYSALQDNTTGSDNSGFGQYALHNIIGNYNTGIGVSALFTSTSGNGNITIGYYSGYYQTNLSNRLYINSLNRTNLLGDTTNSIIYGLQNATSSNQQLYLNSNVNIKHDLTVKGDSINATSSKLKSKLFIGELYIDGDSTLAIPVADTYYTFKKWNTTGVNVNVTADDSSFTINAGGSGYYDIKHHESIQDIANATIHISVFVNDIEITKCEVERKISTGGDVGASSGSMKLWLNDGDVVKLKYRTVSLTGTLTVTHSNFNISRHN